MPSLFIPKSNSTLTYVILLVMDLTWTCKFSLLSVRLVDDPILKALAETSASTCKSIP